MSCEKTVYQGKLVSFSSFELCMENTPVILCYSSLIAFLYSMFNSHRYADQFIKTQVKSDDFTLLVHSVPFREGTKAPALKWANNFYKILSNR